LRLTERPQLVVANKMDMPDSEENLAEFRKKLPEDVKIFPISALSRKGLNELLFAIADLLEVTEDFLLHEMDEEESDKTVLYKHTSEREGFDVTRDDDGAYVLTGFSLERLFKMTDFSREDSIRRFARQMRGMGVDEALREKGAENGDIVRLLEFEFEFMD
jgi:GTP-binding protein